MLNKKGGIDFPLEGVLKLALFLLALFLIIVVFPNFLTFWKGIMATQEVDNIASDITLFHQKSYATGLSSENNIYKFPNVVSGVYIGMDEDGNEAVCASFYQNKIPWSDYCAPISADSPTIMIGEIKDGSWNCDPLMVAISLASWFIPTTWVAKPAMIIAKVGVKVVGKMIAIGAARRVAGAVARGAKFLAKPVLKVGSKLADKTSTVADKLSINRVILNKVVVAGIKKHMAEVGELKYFKSGHDLKSIADDNTFKNLLKNEAVKDDVKKWISKEYGISKDKVTVEGITIQDIKNEKGEIIDKKLEIEYTTGTKDPVWWRLSLNDPADFVRAMDALGIKLKPAPSLGRGIVGKAINGYTKDGKLLFRFEDRGFRESGVFKHEGVLLTGEELLPYKARRILLPGYGAKGFVRMGVGAELYKYGSYDCGTVVNLSFHSCNVKQAGEKLEADTIKFQSDFDLINTIIGAAIGCEPPKKAITHDPCAAGYSTYVAHQNAFLQQKFAKDLEKAVKNKNAGENCADYAEMLFNPLAYNINCYCSDDFVARVTLNDGKYACKGVLDISKGMDCINLETKEKYDGNCSINTTTSQDWNLTKCINDSKSESCNFNADCNLTKQPDENVRFEDKMYLIRIKDEKDKIICDPTTDLDIIEKLRALFGKGGLTTGGQTPHVEINCKYNNKNNNKGNNKNNNKGKKINKKINVALNKEAKDGTFDKNVFKLYDANTGKLTTDLKTTILIRWNCEDGGKCYTCALAAGKNENHFENYTAIKTYIAGTKEGMPMSIKQKYLCTSDKVTIKDGEDKYKITKSNDGKETKTLKCDSCQTVTFEGWDTGNLANPQADKVSYSESEQTLSGTGTASVIAPFVYDPEAAIKCGTGDEKNPYCEGTFCDGINISFNPCDPKDLELQTCKTEIANVMKKSKDLASQNYVVVKVDEIKQQQALVGTPCGG